MKSLTDYILTQNTIPVEVCDNVQDKLNHSEWRKHSWYGSDGDYTFQDKDPFVVNEPDCDRMLVESVNKALLGYSQKVLSKESGGQWIRTFCGMRYNRYNVGSKLSSHYDHIVDLFGGDKGIPVLSIVGVLNDDYEGGEFTFFGELKIPLQKGDILLFPSCFLYPHEVLPVTEGSRLSFVSWAW
jgi:predicted 2-oxoglutarate/Fe(II)-dependent dioxygenase YbiX